MYTLNDNFYQSAIDVSQEGVKTENVEIVNVREKFLKHFYAIIHVKHKIWK